MPQFFEVFDEVDKARKRGRQLLDTAIAIQEGRAEVKPSAVEAGFYGPVGGIDRGEAKFISDTFADSLLRTYAARQKGKKKKKPPTYEVDRGLEAAAEDQE